MSYISNKGVVSTANSTSVALTAGETFTGVGVDVSTYASVVVAAKTDQDGTLYVDFSPDNSNWDSTLSYSVVAASNEVHRISVTRQYCRVRFTNTSAAPQTYLRLSTLFGSQTQLTANLNTTIQSDADSLATRSVLMGATDGGTYKYIPITSEGHLEVALHSPALPFGSVHTEQLVAVFQTDAVYGFNDAMIFGGTSNLAGLTNTAGASAIDSEFVISTGTGAYSQAYVQSRKRIRYRPGQGVVGRFTATFSTPAMSSYQVVGFGHAEDGLYFGYKNTDFGILYTTRGVRDIQTFTLFTGASAAGVLSFRTGINTLSASVTTNNNAYRTAYEISRALSLSGNDYGYRVEAKSTGSPLSANLVFVANDAGLKANVIGFNPGATGVRGSMVQTISGAATTEIFIPQSQWNGDPMDGTGPSGSILVPTYGNVYEIGIQYLGYGPLTCKIEVTPPNSNDSHFVTAHTISIPNSQTKTSFGNPSFPFTAAAYLLSAAPADLRVKVASFAGFIEGTKRMHGPRYSYINRLVDTNGSTLPPTSLVPLFTVYNSRVYKNRTNESVINLISTSGAQDSTRPGTFFLIKNGTLTGNVSLSSYSPNSCSFYDTAATGITYTADQLIWTAQVGDAGNFSFDFTSSSLEDVTLQPGEMVTLAVQAGIVGTTNAPVTISGSLNTREDQ